MRCVVLFEMFAQDLQDSARSVEWSVLIFREVGVV